MSRLCSSLLYWVTVGLLSLASESYFERTQSDASLEVHVHLPHYLLSYPVVVSVLPALRRSLLSGLGDERLKAALSIWGRAPCCCVEWLVSLSTTTGLSPSPAIVRGMRTFCSNRNSKTPSNSAGSPAIGIVLALFGGLEQKNAEQHFQPVHSRSKREREKVKERERDRDRERKGRDRDKERKIEKDRERK